MKYVLRCKESDRVVATAESFSSLMKVRLAEDLIDSTYIDMETAFAASNDAVHHAEAAQY